MLANVLASGHALGAAPRVVTGFVDDAVNHVLGIDAAREAALELVAFGPSGSAPADTGTLPALALETLPLSSREVDYPDLRDMMEASRLSTPDEVRAWRAATPLPSRSGAGTLVPLPPPMSATGRGLSDTVQRRGSTRQFSPAPISAAELATALWAATRPIPTDVPLGLVDAFLIVNAVDGIAPGAYVYRPAVHALELIRAEPLRDTARYLALEQRLAGDASATVFFMAPLDEVRARWGNRGYRLVNLEAGLMGGRAYLVAYALGFGASGLTFYDQLVVEAFAPASDGLDAIFVTALGRSVHGGTAPVIDRISR
jgi:SagB-type dehydrogenase family enzyme